MNESVGYLVRVGQEMVIMDDPSQLLEKTPAEILTAAKGEAPWGRNWGLNADGKTVTLQPFSRFVPPQLVDHYGLLNGDDITYEAVGNNIVVTSICHGGLYKSPPITKLQADYPTWAWPVDSFGFPSLRVANGQAPLGGGSNCYEQGPGGSGKSSLQFELAEAFYRLTQLMPVSVVTYQNGERNKDAGIYYQIRDNVPHDPEHVELYVASVGLVKSALAWNLFEYLIARVRAMARYRHTVFMVDSLHPLVEALSSTISDGGMFSGGLYTEALYTIRDLISVTGNYGPNSSLTIISALLGNYINNVVGGLDELAKRTADNVPDVLWSLVKNAVLAYPRVDVDKTNFLSRRQETFADPRLIQEQNSLEKLKWARDTKGKATQKAEEAHAAMIDYYQSHLIPPWAKFPPVDGRPIVPYHLKLMGAQAKLPPRYAHLLSEEATEHILQYSESRGVPVDVLLDNAVQAHLQMLELDGKGERFYISRKPGSPTKRLQIFPRVQVHDLKTDEQQ